MLRIGIDAGGTFTDFVVLDDGGRLTTFKLRSNRTNPAEVILTGIARAAANAPAAEVLHGSTVATNALLERKGARTAFLTTAGFEDLLAIGRQNRAALYDLTPQPTTPLIPSERCFGIAERDGIVIMLGYVVAVVSTAYIGWLMWFVVQAGMNADGIYGRIVGFFSTILGT